MTCSQEIPPATEQQLETQAERDQSEKEDDSFFQDLEQFKKNPVLLNKAEAEDLKQLSLLTDLQIENFIIYRKLFGELISVYELQAVPSWDIFTIKKVLPYVSIGSSRPLSEELTNRFKKGGHSLLFRVSRSLELSKGFDKSTTGIKYLGSPYQMIFRYQYSYKNLLQFGIVADKDAGEQFFKGAQGKGFDFYSFHVFARKLGIIHSLAMGDYTVNLGQGLIQWQSLAFKKSGDVMAIKRQSVVLRPYHSAGEFFFCRGAGITIKKQKMEATAFVSYRKLSANLVTDTINHENFISSFLSSGYHRTTNENADRNNFSQVSFGGNINYRSQHWHIGINGVCYLFSFSIQKSDEPYNLYAISGRKWWNYSIDYSYTHKNLHFFGETAVDRNFHKAFLNGLLLSVDPVVDISILQRTITKEYQTVNGNAFTENTYPTNETGIYAGITIRPGNGWRLDAYGDIYQFPWLRYGVDGPSHGKDFLVQVNYNPNKQLELYSRFKDEIKQTNRSANTVMHFLVSVPRQSWRIHWNYKPAPSLELRNRIELLWYDGKSELGETGFLCFLDLVYKPLLKPFSGIIRLQYFETEGYNSRIYSYENDVLYSYTTPAFFDKGLRYYLNISYDLRKDLSCWVRWAQTIYRDKNLTGSGLDEINGNKRSELRFQCRFIF